MATREAKGGLDEQRCAHWLRLSVRQRAGMLAALVRWHGREAIVARLAELVAETSSPEILEGAVNLAWHVAESDASPAWRRFGEILLGRTRDGPPGIRKAALLEIDMVSEEVDRKLELLLGAILDDNEDVQEAASIGLSVLGEAAIRPIVAALGDPRYNRPSAHWNLIFALDCLDDHYLRDEVLLRSVVDALKQVATRQASGCSHDSGRWKAVESLGHLHIGGIVGIQALSEIARTAGEPVARWATAELAAFGDEAASRELAALGARDEGRTERPMRAFGERDKSGHSRETH